MTKSDAMWQSSNSWRRRSPPSSSQEEVEEGSRPYQRSALEMRTEHRRAYSPVAETLFRKDLISAMKLPDNEPLEPDDYWTVQDTWKQEWEKGVQVPVKPDVLPEPQVTFVTPSTTRERFTLPRKLICMNTNGSYTAETHQVTPMVLRAEQVCTYDLDDVDQTWLNSFNGERALMGLGAVTENEMERTMEELESQVWEKISSSLRNSDDLEIAQDDSVICDVCRSPESEETNEMVFCDKCNICVHQACYGIMNIPSGPWVCRTCDKGIKPPCELCPNKGGAMKSTRSGMKWAHVSCALWIPEVSIGCVEKMEPITKISSIPTSRWSLVCVLCKERMGSCIQCSVKTCKTAYHVTCAFRHNLEMRAIIEDENAEDGVKLRSYCQKHSLNCKKKMEDSDSDSGGGGRKQNLSPEDRRKRMARIEREFFKLVDLAVVAAKVQVTSEIVDFIYRYWILKRRAGNNKPLLPPRGDDESLSGLKAEDTERDKLKMMVEIRQDLERVRNLAYMVSRREKLSRSFLKLREQILEKQLVLLADEEPTNQMSLLEMSAVLEANHGPTIYDRTFSNPEAEQPTYEDFEAIVARIAGEITEGSAQIRKDNPFRKKSVETSSVAGGSGGGGGGLHKADSLKYERIFSDTSQSESDDSFIQNVKPVTARRTSLGSGAAAAGGLGGSQHGKKSRTNKDISSKAKPAAQARPAGKKPAKPLKTASSKSTSMSAVATAFPTDSSMSSSEEEAALKKLSPRKEFGKSPSGRNSVAASAGSAAAAATSKRVQNIYSDSDSDNEMAKASSVAAATSLTASGGSSRGRRPGKKPGKSERKKTESSSAEGRRDSEDTLDLAPRSPVFRTKAAMKEFSLEDLHRAKELAKNSSSSRSTAVVSPSKEAAAVSKPVSLLQEGKQMRQRIGSSPVLDAMDTGQGPASEDDEELLVGPPIILVPERSAARKANQRLKFPATEDKSKKTTTESVQLGDTSAPLGENSRKKTSAVSNNKNTASLFGDSDSDDLAAVGVASGTRGRSRSPTKAVAAVVVASNGGREVRKSPRGGHLGAAALVSPPSDSELSDVEPLATKPSAIPVVKQQPSKKSSKTVYDKAAAGAALSRSSLAFSDDEDGEISFLPAKEKPTKAAAPSSAAMRLNNRNHKPHNKSPPAGEVEFEFDSLLPSETKVPSDSESETEFRNKKREFDDFENPEMLPFVPQRKAAKKASEQLREQDMWKKTQQEMLLASLQQAQLDKVAGIDAKKRGRQGKKKKGVAAAAAATDSDAELFRRRRRSSDSSSSSSSSSSESDSESAAEKTRSPRGRGAKSPKGAKKSVGKTHSPRTAKAPAVKRQRNSNKKSPRGSRPDGVISSSKALEYLNQRESQISNILESYTREEINAGKDPPDKKLKTSEGRPDQVQSPPAHSKTSTDSESDADSSSDSIIIQQSKRASNAQPASGVLSATGAAGQPQEPAAAEQPETASLQESEQKPSRNISSRILDDPSASVTTSVEEPSSGAGLRPVGGGAGNSRRMGDNLSPEAARGWTEVERDAGKDSPVTAPVLERLKQPTGLPSPAGIASPAAASKQLQQSTPSPAAAAAAATRSIFSPDRPAAPSADGPGVVAREYEPSGQKENESPVSWRSPRDGKPTEGRSPRLLGSSSSVRDKVGVGRDLPLGPIKSPGQSPALSRSFESVQVGGSGGVSRASPQLTNRSPAVAVAQSPTKSSPHHPPAPRTLDSGLKNSSLEEIGSETLLPALNKSDNEPEELPGSSSSDIGRKYSVESKDSDVDSAKSSLLDASDTIMRDFGKEEEEEEEAIVRDITTTSTTAKVFSSITEEAMSLARHQQQQQQTQMIHASGVQQAKMDEGYVSAEKVHPADPIVQSLALFESSLLGTGGAEVLPSKRGREPVGTTAAANHPLEQPQATAAAITPLVKSPTAVAPMAALPSSVLQAEKESTDMMDVSRQQDYLNSNYVGKKQQQQKAAEEELAQFFNQAVAAAASSASATVASGMNSAASTAAAAMPTWSEQLQQLQQHQLQQQLQLMDSRSWQAPSFSSQIEPLKGKQHATAAATDHHAEKKAAESMLAAAASQQHQHQQQQYQEALLNQMLSTFQTSKSQQQHIAYAQQYMKELSGMKGVEAQNLELYNQMGLQQYMQQISQNFASYGLNKKVHDELLYSAWHQAEAGWYSTPAMMAKQQQPVPDMDKISRSGISELEKMTREQQQQYQLPKTSRQQQQQQASSHHHHQHHKAQPLESRPPADQRSYLDQLRSQEQKSFQEQLRAQERRAQSDSSGRQPADLDSAARFQAPASRVGGFHHQHNHNDTANKVDPTRNHLDVLAQFSQQLAGKVTSEGYGRTAAASPPPPADKAKVIRQSHDHHLLPSTDGRSGSSRVSLHQGESVAKKTSSTAVDPYKLSGGDLRSQYDLLAYAANENLRIQAAAQQQQTEQQHIPYHYQGAYHHQQQYDTTRDQLASYSAVARDSISLEQQQHQQALVDPTSFSCQKQQQQQYLNKLAKDMPGAGADPYRRLASPLQPSRTKAASPRHEGANTANTKPAAAFSSSCRIEQQQQQKQQQEVDLLLHHQHQLQDQIYGIPSATPADKLPGFVPSVAHSRDLKRQSHEGALPQPQQQVHQDQVAAETPQLQPQQSQRKGRDTPASVAGSDASHNSAPTSGIPNELLDSVLETAKLPVWRPPDTIVSGGRPDSLKMASPAKPPQASPPKSAPVMSSERDNTSALEELVKHIDASPSPRDSTRTVSSNLSLTPSHQAYSLGGGGSGSAKKDVSDHQHPQQHLPHQHPNHPPHLGGSSSPSPLVYSNIPELMGETDASCSASAVVAGGPLAGGHHSDKDLSEAERSDYDNEQHDKGGVDYYDEEDDDEDDLPLGARRRGGPSATVVSTKSAAAAAAVPDISSWGQAKPTTAVKTAKELKINLRRPASPAPPPLQSSRPAKEEEEEVSVPATKPETLTKRGTRVPCYREEPEEEAPELPGRRPLGGKMPCYKDAQPAGPSSGAVPVAGGGSVRGKMRGGRGAGAGRLFGRKSGPKYDQKAFELVHKKLAGTDFDFEGEFDDDFAETPKEDGLSSLRDFRVASKNKRNESFGSESGDVDLSSSSQIPPLQFDFDDVDSSEETKPPLAQPVVLAVAKGKGRTTKQKKPVWNPEKEPERPAEVSKVVPLRIKNSIKVAEEDEEKKKVATEHPKIPKLKIKLGKDPAGTKGGAEPSLLRQVRKGERRTKLSTEALQPLTARDGERKEEIKPSLKFKIKVPKKLVSLPEQPHNGDLQLPRPNSPPLVGVEDPLVLPFEPEAAAEEDPAEQQHLVIRSSPATGSPIRGKGMAVNTSAGRTPVQDKILENSSIGADIQSPPDRLKADMMGKSSPEKDLTTTERAMQDPTVVVLESAAAQSPAVVQPVAVSGDPSPRKPKSGSSIDSLANKLLAKQQSSTELSVSQASELVAIFGPEEPLPVNIIGEAPLLPGAASDRPDDGPSELDLLTMELKKLEREQQQKEETAKSSTGAAESSAPSGTSDTIAVLASERLEPDLRLDRYEEGAHSKKHHQLKYKFKPQHLPPQGEQNRSSSPLPGPSSHHQPPVKINLLHHSSSSSAAAASVVDIHMRRMRKKELLNSYLGIEAPVQAPTVVQANGPLLSHYQTEAVASTREPVRMNIIKMPKAVASVTSVPTRADYQSQLEANLERKRKREGKEDLGKVKGQKKGKGKQGRKDDSEEAYRPKLKKNADSGEESETKGELRVRTRGKPPKKCLLEESPEREGPLDSFKKTNLRYAEEIRKQFDLECPDDPLDGNFGGSGGGSAELMIGEKEERRRKEKKRRRDDDDIGKEMVPLQPKGKSPRIVIKISKNKDSASKALGKDNNGLTQPVAITNDNIHSLKVQPLKIKL